MSSLPPTPGLRRAAATLVALLGGFAALPAAAQQYDAVSSFSTANGNPNGVWSYLDSNTPTTPDVGLATLGAACSASCTGVAGLSSWSNGGGIPDFHYVEGYSGSGSASYYTVVQPNTLLNLDPENGVTAVRFTAPTTGVYSLSGMFEAIDVDHHTTTASIYDDGFLIPTAQYTVGAYQDTHAFSFAGLALTAGDQIDFVVRQAASGDYAFLSTGLAAQFTGPGTTSVTPEPSTWVLLAAGLGGLGAVARRRKA